MISLYSLHISGPFRVLVDWQKKGKGSTAGTARIYDTKHTAHWGGGGGPRKVVISPIV